MAVSLKKPVIGLETVEQQIAVIDSQRLEEQIKQLTEAAANPDKGFNDFKALYRTYLTQNTDELFKLIETQIKDYKMSQSEMLDNRNRNWIPVIEKNIPRRPPSSPSAADISAAKTASSVCCARKAIK